MGDPIIRRLGKRELGPYAFETHLPVRLQEAIEHEDLASTSVPGIVDNLALLLQSDSDVQSAYLCTHHAVQVSKMPDEGAHFCGYRNLQMLLLTLAAPASANRLELPKSLTIPQIQDMIEAAWTRGYNAHGRAQTGGIKGTRKHIGTSEAEALLLSLKVSCTGTIIAPPSTSKQLFDLVESFFAAGCASTDNKPSASDLPAIYRTNRCPIFLQGPKHSITIVGLETSKAGSRQLLTFDPGWQIPAAMHAPLKVGQLSKFEVWRLLQRYRKSSWYLRMRGKFEMLVVDQR